MESLNDFGGLQSVLQKFPKLAAYVDRVEALPSVSKAIKTMENSY